MKLPLLSGKQLLTTLKRLGFLEASRRGSHVKMVHPDGRKIVFTRCQELRKSHMGGQRWYNWDIYMIDLNNLKESRLTSEKYYVINRNRNLLYCNSDR